MERQKPLCELSTRALVGLLFGISMSRLESPRVQSPLLAQWSQIMLQDTVWFMAAPAHSHRGLDTDNYLGSPGIVCVVLNPLRSKVNGILLPWLLHPTKAWSQDSHCPRGTKVAVTTKYSFHPQKQTFLVPAGQVSVVTQVTLCALFVGLKAVIANSLTSSETLCFGKCCKVALWQVLTKVSPRTL